MTDKGSSLSVWWRRALTLALCFAYAPALIVSPLVLHEVAGQRELAALSFGALASCFLVGVAFGALTLGARFIAWKTQRRLYVLLLAYWLPHMLLVACWCFAGGLDRPSAWID